MSRTKHTRPSKREIWIRPDGKDVVRIAQAPSLRSALQDYAKLRRWKNVKIVGNVLTCEDGSVYIATERAV